MPSDRESRRIAQQRIVETMTTHSVWLHRAATAQVNEMTRVIDEMGGELARALSDRLDNLTPAELTAFSQGRYHTDRLKGLRNTIDKWAATLATRIDTLAKEGFEQFAGHEASFARRLITESVEGDFPPAPTAAAAYAAAMRSPVLGELVEDMLSDIPERTRRQVYSRIRQGVSQGEPNHQIIRALRGTKALNYKDGTLQWARNQVDTLVRTSRGHISNEAYDQTYQALGVEFVVDVATLDGRTCFVAGSLIETPNGARPIEELRPGDSVFGGSGMVRRVSGATKATTMQLCRVTLDNGEVLTCTPDHRIWTGRGWIEAKDLMVGEGLPDRLQ